ncbi:MAG: MBG domain-containing protein [Chitinophagaceae bacterium]
MKVFYRKAGIALTAMVFCFANSRHAEAQAVGSDFTQTTIFNNFSNPWDINFGPDGYLWWTESKTYKLFRTDVNAGSPAKEEIFDFSSSRLFTSSQNPWPQGGLMGFAFHPDFANKPFIYVAYVYRFDGCVATNVSCNFRNRIERYTYNAGGSPKLTNPVTLIDLAGSSDHNGGRMAIGPDNKLYYCQSDMGAGQFANAGRTENTQDVNILEGKVLRLNLDADAGESGGNEWIPNDNPFSNAGSPTAVYTLGHRNHQGLVWANLGAGVNRLYQSEHGPQSDDELNLIESARNYGYPKVTGFADGYHNNISNGPYTAGPLNGNPTEQQSAITLNVKLPLSTLGTTTPTPFTNPVGSNATWPSVAPSGIDYYGLYPNGPVLGWTNSVLIATLKNSSRVPSVQRVSLSSDGTAATNLYNYWTSNNVRYRDVAIAPNGRDIYILQDNTTANLYRLRYNVASNAGFYATGGGLITYSIDGGADVNSYNKNVNLGFPTSFILKGGVIHTTKTGTGNICSGTMNYRVYKQGTSPGAFTTLSGFTNDASNSFTTTATPANVTGSATGQQRWSKNDAAIDIKALATLPGIWVLETYFEATGNVVASSGCTDGFRLNNGGYNYRYYFSAGPLATTTTVTALSAISYGSTTPVTLKATVDAELLGTGTVTFTIDGNIVGTGAVNASGVATYSYTPNTLTASGSPHTVTAEFAATNFTSSTSSASWVVNKAVIAVTSDGKNKAYNGAVFSPFTSTYSGFVNSETASVITGSVTFSGAATTAVNAGTYTITPVVSGLTASNYIFNAVNGSLQITKVALTVTAADKSKTYSATVFSPFTVSYSGFVNSETSSVVTGTVTYSGTAAAAVNAGTYTITPVVTGLSATNYSFTVAGGSLQINKAVLTVTADARTKTYTGTVYSPFTSTYTGFAGSDNSGVVSGTITYAGGAAATAVNVGSYTITPTVTGLSSTNYTFTPANGILQINKAVLTVTADAKSKTYDGSGFSGFTNTITGYVNSENGSVVSGTVGYSGPALTALNAGSYTIIPDLSGLSATNYSFTPVNGTLQINKVAINVTADAKSKAYNGSVFAPFTATYSGFVNSETPSVVTGSITHTGTAISAVNAGTYTITPVVTGLSATNYSFTPVNGSLQINKVGLTVTADPKAKTYTGTVYSPFTATYSGFVNSETSAVVAGTTTYTGPAASAVNFGSYTITPVVSGLSATNYTFTPVNGTLQINKVDLTIIADSKTKTYTGTVYAPFTTTISGFVNSETSAVVSVTVSYAGTAVAAVDAGDYTVTPVVTSFSATNYTFTPVNGTLQINKAGLTVTADPKNKIYDGTVFSAFTSSITGYVNTEDGSVVSGIVGYSGPATSAVNFGSYTIAPDISSLAAANYTFIPVNDILQINKASLTVTADNKNKTYDGAPFSGFTATIAGYVNSENASVVSGSATYSGSAVAAVNSGTYAIMPVVTGLSAANYSFTPADGSLQINKVSLLVTATNVTVNYQDAVPLLTYTIAGFVNSENSAVVSGSPGLTTAYTNTTPVAASPVMINAAVGSLSANNYSFSFQDGQVFILPLTYYNIPGTDISQVDSWGANVDGSGVHPMNFSISKYQFNLASGTNVAGASISISGLLDLTGGIVDLGNSNLTCVSISGGGPGTFIRTNGTGTLKISNIGPGGLTGNILFPVGIGSSYAPVELANSGTADGFSVRVQNGFSGAGRISFPDSAVNLLWDISEDIAGGSDASVTLGWNSFDQGIDFNPSGAHVIGHYTGGAWVASPSSTAGTTTTAAGFTGFSPFAVGMAGAFTDLTITGTVFNDADGISNSLIDGTGTGLPSGEQLYLNLLKAGTVVGSVPINADGTYGFNSSTGTTANATFSLVLSTVQGTVGATVASVLPAGWAHTAQGSGIGDGTFIDGLSTVSLLSDNVTGLNFGIEQLPTAGGGTSTAINPQGTISVSVPANTFTNTMLSSDITPGTVSSIRITAFPTNTTSITINGIVYHGDVPAEVVALVALILPVNGSGTPSATISLDPDFELSGTSVISFKATDNAGKESLNSGTATMNFDSYVSLQVKVLLEGATIGNGTGFESTMRDNLRNSPFTGANYIPSKDPYTFNSQYNTLFTRVGDGLSIELQTVTDSAAMFNSRGTASAVDWVFIELRDKTNPATVVDTRSAMVERDGTVVDIDGSSCIRFPTLPLGDYYVAVRHRNHLGVMTAAAVPAAILACAAVVDFTTMTAADLWNQPGYDGYEMKTLADGKHALWAGNANGDRKIKYTAPNDDLFRIFTNTLQHPDNSGSDYNFDFGYGYIAGDVNMNSKVKYTAPNDDSFLVFVQLLLYGLNGGSDYNYDFFLEQLP